MVQNKIRHICFLTANYPTKEDPVFPFVRELIMEIADQGIRCTVISPQSIWTKIKGNIHSRPTKWTDTSTKGEKVEVYQPCFFSLSKLNRFKFGFNELMRKNTIKRAFENLRKKTINNPIDCLYAHFWNEGITASEIAKKYGIKSFVASGESIISIKPGIWERYLKNNRNFVTGCICVSQKNREESLRYKLIEDEKIRVIPNAIKSTEFYHEDKVNMRRKFSFPEDVFIVAFCGYFINRKGINRLSEAIKQLDDVYTIFIGSGPIQPTKKNNLFCGKIPHAELVHYLNCADVFVLPTLAEGCCNAIIEAMACGLPIVSSNKNFNDDILTDEYSIRIDSTNVSEIVQAISHLKKDPEKLDQMSEKALRASEEFELSNRAIKIINFMEGQ